MSYVKKIEIYRLLMEFNSPLASEPEKMANCAIGDFLVVIGETVFIQDKNDEREAQYAAAIYSPAFVRMNPNIFEKMDYSPKIPMEAPEN